MRTTVDVAYKSLNKHTEILCGDKVGLLQTEDSSIMILADGMGSGVKADVLSTLTPRILGAMFLNGATLEECVDAISETPPICQVRQAAYSTSSILQVYHSGDAYLVEYDNPGCVFIQDGKFMKIPKNIRVMQGKEINEYRFKVKKGDALILVSDSTIHAGVGGLLNFGRLWQDIANYAVRQYPLTVSVMRLAASISRACDELYQFWPGDDTAVVCMRIVDSKPIHLMTDPVRNPEDDVRTVQDFMDDANAKTIVCGGTSATVVSRVLGKKLDIFLDYADLEIPPIVYMDGVGLVAEGVLTLNRVLQLLRRHVKNKTVSEEFFQGLDEPNGSSMMAKVFIENCTEVHLCVGKVINSAYQNPGLPFNLGIHQNLVEQLRRVIEEMGKTVVITYH